MNKFISIGAPAIGVMAASTLARAALSSPTDARVVFDAAGPAGMKIEGTTSDLNVAEDSGNVVITVPLANLTTGISLRDHHMRDKYLEVPKFPAAVLTIPRAALKFPNPSEKVEADAQGTITLHGQSRPVSVHYDTKDDGSTLAAMFRAQARAVEVLEKDPTPYLHYLIAETGGLLEPHELQTWRLLHAAPQPYTRGRFDDTYNWTVKWNMVVPGATYEKVVDNRAWE